MRVNRNAVMATKTSREAFLKVFPSIVKDISSDAQKYNLPPNALEWFQKVGERSAKRVSARKASLHQNHSL